MTASLTNQNIPFQYLPYLVNQQSVKQVQTEKKKEKEVRVARIKTPTSEYY